MKLKNYSIVWAMSLLILSTSQFFASDDRSQELQKSAEAMQPEVAIKVVEPKVADVDEFIYDIKVIEQPIKEGVFVEPKIISNKTVASSWNTGKTRTLITEEVKNGKIITTTETWKTKNPSYFTWSNGVKVVAAGTVAILLYSQWRMLLNNMKLQKRIQKLMLPASQSQLDVYNVNSSENAQFIAQLAYGFSDDEYDDFIDKLNKYAEKKGSSFLTMLDISNVYYEMMDSSSQNNTWIGSQIKYLQDTYWPTTIGQLWEGESLTSAYHEAGHAIMQARSKEYTFNYMTNVPVQLGQVNSGGHSSASYQNILSKLFFGWSNDFYKDDIMIDLAGGIAMSMMVSGRKLPFKEFLKMEHYGMGSVERPGSDIYNAHRSAERYLAAQKGWFYVTSIAQHKRDLNELLEKCYNETYDILESKKDVLVLIAHELHRKKTVPDTHVYKTMGIEKSKPS